MNNKDIEQKVIEQYQQDENMMILVFAQWCVNNDLDPKEMYLKAYPVQSHNAALEKVLELTVPKQESEHISNQSVLGVLQLFGNHDLAFIVSEEINKQDKRNGS